jgi:hypothetical protein
MELFAMEVDLVSMNIRNICTEQNNNLVTLAELTIFGSADELTELVWHEQGMQVFC